MKQFIITALCGLMIPALSAQEALGSRAALTSPEINADGSVTLRLDAPRAENVTAVISGTPTAMRKDSDGVWTLTVSNLRPDLHTYTFYVDGVKTSDPNNVFEMRDVATVSNLMIIPGAESNRLLTQDIPHGDVTKKWYHSRTFGCDRRLSVYTPPSYNPRGDRRYPVLYLLHGMGGDENAWIELGRAAQIFDSMTASGKMPEMIVVMPNGNVAMQAAPGDNPGPLRQPDFNLPRTMNGEFERSFPEIVAWTDSVFLTIPRKNARAVAGLSMGGLNSLTISMNNPEMFDYIGLFSPATPARALEKADVYANVDAKLARQAAGKPALYWLGIGREDFLYEANVEFRRQLDAAGMNYIYHESEDGHVWKNWRDYLPVFLQLINDTLKSSIK